MESVENKGENLKNKNYLINKSLYRTRNGELFFVNISDDTSIYIMKRIEVKTNEDKNKILEELKLLKQINSKYFIKINNYFIEHIEEKEIICVIIDYFDIDKNLKKLIYNSNFLNTINIWKIFIEIAITIKSIHKQNIIIENLNPQNIFLDKKNNIKIGGIGKVLDLINEEEKLEESELYIYKSPEILNDEKYDDKCDVWSLGCILYELYFKKKAFDNKSNIINIKYDIDEDVEVDLKFILKKLLCEQKIRYNSRELVFDPIFKNKIIEVNMFSEIIANDMKSKFIFLNSFLF